MGSPALAAYSLALTSLNVRSVYRKAERVANDSKNGVMRDVARHVARALTALQQTSLELTKDERLLNFIATDDHWRQGIADRLGRRNALSVTTGLSIAWVVIAFLLNLVDSFALSSNSDDGTSEGHAVAALWLWLLGLVIGWLLVPTFTHGEVNAAIYTANRRAVEGAIKAIRLKTHNMRRGIIERPPVRLSNRLEKSVPPHNKPTAGSQHGHLSDSANRSTLSLPYSTGVHSTAVDLIPPDPHEFFILKEIGSPNRNELRSAPIFNYSRIMQWHALVDDVLGALGRVAHEESEVGPPRIFLTLEVI